LVLLGVPTLRRCGRRDAPYRHGRSAMVGADSACRGVAVRRSFRGILSSDIIWRMVRRILTWDPPLMVTVLCLFGLALAIPFLTSGNVSAVALLLAALCSGAQAGRKRRLNPSRY
jgi:hypothetical protein